MGAVSSVVDTVADAVSGVVEAVGDVGSDIDDFVNDEIPGGWATIASVAAPTYAPYIQAADVLDEGGSLEDALVRGATTYGLQQAFSNLGGTTDTTGLDMGDVIPTTPAQLEGLYPVGGTFTPPVIDTTGLDIGDVIPTTPIDQTLYEIVAQPTVTPSEVVATPAPVDTTGIDMGEVIPTTPAQLEGLYPASNTFLPTGTDVVSDYFDPQKTTTPLTARDVLNMANVGLTAAAILNPPEMDQGTGATFYPLQPIPEDWKSPVYQTEFTPIDLNSIFGNQNLLANTQWAIQPQQVQFAQAPTMQNLTDMIQNVPVEMMMLTPTQTEFGANRFAQNLINEAPIAPQENIANIIGPQVPNFNEPIFNAPNDAYVAPMQNIENIIGPQVQVPNFSDQLFNIPVDAYSAPRENIANIIGPQVAINTLTQIPTAPITSATALIGPQVPNMNLSPFTAIPSAMLSDLSSVIGPQVPNFLGNISFSPSANMSALVGPSVSASMT